MELSTFFKRSVLLPVLSVIAAMAVNNDLHAQCFPDQVYDKIVSGYHASIALLHDGSFQCWGEDMDSTGDGNELTPTSITSARYPNLTGTPLKSAVGGDGSQKDQYFMLTTTHLFVWGNTGYVVNSSLTPSAAFQKITASSITNADTTGLPPIGGPSHVTMLFATYQTLTLVTDSGFVYVLTQSSAPLQGDGSGSVTSTTWHKVKTNSSTYLTNVTAIRGQASSSGVGALMAVCSNGTAYTWGPSVYIGDGTYAKSESYATQMTLPSEFSSSNVPYMIAVSGGLSSTYTSGSGAVAPSSVDTNSFYVLSSGGSLYALGCNADRQLGDFTTTTRTSWVHAKKTGTQNFTDITYISVQESDNAFPAVAAVSDSANELFSWGYSSYEMLGEAVDSGYNPHNPKGFHVGEDVALFPEMGGHTLVYLKDGSAQFCYVGHKIDGSMGDGTTASTEVDSFDCSNTPSVWVCGSVPVAANDTTSTISPNPSSIEANGVTTSIITVQLKTSLYEGDSDITTTGGTVTMYTNHGTLSAVTDNNNGTYTAILTSCDTVTTATISYAIEGSSDALNTCTVAFTPCPISGASPSTCTGSSVTLSDSTVGGTWVSNNTAVATVGSTTGTVYGVSAGTATISYVDDGLVTTKVVTVQATPSVSAISGTSSISSCGMNTFTDGTSGGTWSSSNPSVASVGSTTGDVTGVSSGSAVISYKVTNSCGTAAATTTVSVAATSGSSYSPPISRCAGNGTSGYGGDGGPATAASMSAPADVCYDGGGNCYIVDQGNHCIRKVDPSGTITTICGTGSSGYSGDGGPASSAKLNSPAGIACDGSGNIYIADMNNHCVRKIDASGNISTCAGTGTSGFSGDGGSAGSAALNHPCAVACDGSGNLYIADRDNQCVRKVDNTGTIHTCAGTGGTAGYSGDGSAASACMLYLPTSVKCDASGNVYINDENNSRIRKVDNTGNINTVCGNGSFGYSGDGGDATSAALNNPYGVCVDGTGNIYISDLVNQRVRMVDNTGKISTVCGNGTRGSSGDGGPASAAEVYNPMGICTDQFGNVCFADNVSNACRKISPSGSYISGTASICTGASATLSDVICGGTWTSSNTSVATVGASSGVIYGAASGTATISYSYTGYTATQVVTVLPSASAGSISGTATICTGSTTSLTDGVSGGTWSSSNTAVGSVNNSGVVTGMSAGTTTISYAETNTCGTAYATDVVTVGTVPTVAAIAGTSSGCAGSTMTLSDATGGGSWSSSNTAVGTVNAGVVACRAAGTATISYAVTNSCGTTTKTVNVTVNALPTPTFTTTAGSSICSGASATYTTQPGESNYVWTVPGVSGTDYSITSGGISTTDYTVTLQWLTTGSKTVTVSYSGTGGCAASSPATTTTSVSTTPSVASISGSAMVCAGATTNYTDATGSGTWSSSNTAVGTVSSGGVVGGMTSGTATISYSITSACGSTAATAVITVSTTPTVASIAGTMSVCSSSTTSLSDATGSGAWTSGATAVATVSGGVVTGVATGTAMISYTVSNTCGSTVATAVVTVGTVPTVASITGTSSVCMSGTTTLSDATGSGTWSSSNNAVGSVNSGGVVAGLTTGSATISYGVTNSCGTTYSTYVVNVGTTTSVSSIGGAAYVCAGGTTGMTDATGGGVWSSTNAGVATIGTSGTVTGMGAGTTTISYTVTNSCGTTAATAVITVSTTPTVASITGTMSVCSSSTTSLSDATGSGAWTSGATAVATVSGGVVSGVSTGTAMISYTVSNTCGSTVATAVVTVGTVPTVASITGTPTVCMGSSVTLSDATGSGTWSSSNSAVGSVNSGGVVAGLTTGSATISYSVTNSCGTTYSTYVVNVGTTVSVATIGGAASVCAGSTTGMTDATGGGVWSSTNTGVATIATDGTVTGMGTGTTTISYSVTNSCGTAAAAAVIAVNTLPTVSSITGTASVCMSATSTLSDATSGGVWSSSNTAAATVSSGIVSGVAAGTTTISYAVTNGCGTTVVTDHVTVDSLPVPSFTTEPASTMCASTNATYTTQTGESNYTWSVPGTYGTDYLITFGGDGTSSTTVTLLWYTTGSKTVTINYTDANGCSGATPASSTTNVVAPMTVSAISGAGSVCTGSATTMSDGTGGGAWSSSNTTVGTVDGSGDVTGVSAGTTTISYTVSNVCGSVSALATVSVGTAPVVGVIGGTTTVCNGSTTSLSDGTGGGAWSSSNTAVATVSSGVVTGTGTGSATITYAVTNSCGTTNALATITVGTTPSVSSIGGSASVCAGSTTGMTDATGSGVWSSTNTGVATIATGGTVTGMSGGTSTISYSVTNSCGTTAATAVITVSTTPTVASIVGTMSVCSSSTTSLSDATGSGAWTSGATAVATVSGGVVTGVATGTAMISYTVSNTCGSTVATAVVTVGTVPTVASITGTSSVCMSGTTTLSDATGSGTWSSSNSAVGSVNSGGVVAGLTTGSATISYGVTNSCGTTYSTYVVNVGTTVSVATIGGAASVCAGSTTGMTDATGGGVWSSTNAGVATIGTSGTVTGMGAGTTTISYTVTNSCGTTAATAVITVSTTPTVASITGTMSVCSSSTTSLSDATGSGAWTSGATAVATVSGGVVSGVSTGTAMISYTVSNTCGSTVATAVVTVGTVPTVASITGTPTVCMGSSVTLSDATGSGTWSSSNSAVGSVNSGGVVAGLTTGSATISYSVTNSCGTTYSTYVVNVGTTVSVATIGGAASVCAGSTTGMTDATGGGVWSSTNTGVATIATDGTVTGMGTGTTTISYSVTNSCGTAAAAAVIAVNTLPTVSSITGTASVCMSATSTLSDATSGGVWSSSNTAAATVSSGIVSGVAAGTTTISYAVTNGCGTTVVTDHVTVDSLPVPSFTTEPASTMCASTNATYTTQTGESNYTWSVPGTYGTDYLITFGGDGTSSTTVTLLWYTTGSKTVTINYTDANGCSGATPASSTTNVVAPMTVSAISGAGSVCTGSATTMSDGTGGGAWSSSNTTVGTVDGSGDVTGVSAGTTTISYTVSNVCGSVSALATVSVGTAPVVGVIGGTTTVCNGSTTSLSDGTGGGAWSSSNTAVATVSSGVVTGTGTGSATITYAVTNSCGTTNALATITVGTTPSVSSISGSASVCAGSTTGMTDATGSGVWSSTNTGVATIATGGTVTGMSGGTSTISYSVTNSCGTTAATAVITVSTTPTVASITGTMSVCSSSTTSLSDATGSGAWTSGATAVATVSGGVVTGVATGTAMISYTVSNTCGSTVATAVVTVGTVPTVASITGTSSVCMSGTTTLSDATGSGTWSSSNNAVGSVNSGGVVAGLTTGSATISYGVTNSCGTTYSTYVVNVGTTVSVATIGGAASVCAGGTTGMTDATSGGVWSSTNTGVATVATDGTVTGMSGGTTTISYTVTNSCGTTAATAVITINTVPTVSSMTGTASVCMSATSTLSDATSGGVWSSSNTAAATVSGGIVSGVAAGTTTISYAVTNGCGTTVVTDLVTVHSLPTPSFTAAPATSMCDSTNATYTTQSGEGTYTWTVPGVYGTDYLITYGGTGTSSPSATLLWYTAGAKTVSVNYTDANGCMGASAATFTTTVVNVPVVAAITGTMHMCVGSGVTLADATTGGVWSSLNTTVATITSGGNVSGVAAGGSLISYTVTNACGAVASTAIVTVDSIPTATRIVGTSQVDSGYYITLFDTTVGGVWTSSNPAVAAVGSICGQVLGMSRGTAVISYTISNTCTTVVNTATVTVLPTQCFTPFIYTIAGNGSASYSGDGGPATAGSISGPIGVACDAYGNVYIADAANNRIRKVNSGGVISTCAGNGTAGFGGDGGAATNAKLNYPTGVVCDNQGNIYIADENNNCIRKVNASGNISTCVGNGTPGYTGDGGPATVCELHQPIHVTTDFSGNLFIVDFYNSCIRKVDVNGYISTVAGNGISGFSGDGGPATSAMLYHPTEVACDGKGNIYIDDENNVRIRKVNASGNITTIAGVGTDGYNGDEIAATTAKLFQPYGVCVDAYGRVFIGDRDNTVCRYIDTFGVIHNYAGDHTRGFAGDNGPAVNAELYLPYGVCLDGNGYLYVADNINNRIRKVGMPVIKDITGTNVVCVGLYTTFADSTAYGTWSSSNTSNATVGISNGIVDGISAGTATITYQVYPGCYVDTTVVVNPLSPITGTSSSCVGSGSSLNDATTGGAWSSSAPTVAAVDATTGAVTGMAAGSAIISYVLPTGCIATVVYNVNPIPASIGGGNNVCALASVSVSDATSGGTWSSADGTTATASGGALTGVAAGTTTITYTISATGCYTTTQVTVNPLPAAIAGTWWVCRGSSTGLTDATGGGNWTSGNTGVATVSGGSVTGVSYGTATISYTLSSTGCMSDGVMAVDTLPTAVTIYGDSLVYPGYYTTLHDTSSGGVWSSNNNALATVGSANGVVAGISTGYVSIVYTITNGCGTTTATRTVTVGGSWCNFEDIYTIAGQGTAGSSGDGGPGTAAQVNSPKGVCVDGHGNLYIADESANRVREIYPDGTIHTFAGNGSAGFSGDNGAAVACALNTPKAVSCDNNGNVYIADYGNNRIRVVNGAGIITTCVGTGTAGYSGNGGAATAATIDRPIGVSCDGHGNLYEINYGSCDVRKIDASGTITLVCGTPGTPGYSGDGGAATSAAIRQPTGIFCDTSGNVYIDDEGNVRIRKISAATGNINTIAGMGYDGYNGENIPATSAVLFEPYDVCVDNSGNVYISDRGNYVIRQINPAGIISDYCGNGVRMISGDGGPATAGSITTPFGICTDGAGNLYICQADPGSAYIRKVAPATIPATIGGDTVCTGYGSTISDAVTGGTWTSGNTSIFSVDPTTGNINGVAAGTSTITYVVGNTCTSIDTISVRQTPPAITGTFAICNGLTTTLADTSTHGVWISSSAGVATIGSNTGFVTGMSAGTTIITYLMPLTGCYNNATLLVNPLPAAITGVNNVCVGLNTTLHNVTTGGTWSSADVTVASINSGTGVMHGVLAGITTITFTITATGCISTQQVTVNALPAAVTGTVNVCAGLSTTLSDASDLGSGSWSSGNTGVATIDLVSGVVSGVAAGTTNITYTIPATGCIATAAYLVNPLPAAVSGAAAMCLGNSVTLTDATDAGSGSWSSSDATVSVGLTTGVVSGLSAGTAVITYTIPATGCIKSKAVVVNPLPSAITGTATVCAGLSTTLSDASDLGSGSWSSGNTGIATVGLTSGSVAGVLAGTTIITYMIPATGCIAVAEYVVNQLPAGITGLASVCTGYSIALADASDLGSGSWSSSNTGVATADLTTGSISGLTSGTTMITYAVPATGCIATKVISSNGTPSALTGTTTVCAGSNTALGEVTTGGAWSSGNTAVGTVDGSGNVGGISAGSVIISYSVGTGCYVTAGVTVYGLPTVSATASPNPICSGSTLGLTASASGGTGSYSIYNWSGPDAFAVGTVATLQTIPSITSSYNGVYSVTATDTHGCTSLPGVTSFVTVNPTPGVYTLTGGAGCAGTGADVSLSATDAGISYQLFLTGTGAMSGSVAGGAGSSPYAIDFGNETTAGSYYVIATNNTSLCTSFTTDATVTINPLPTVYTLTGGSACAGTGGVDISMNASDAGNSYQLYLSGTGTVGGAIGGGSGSSPYPIDFGSQSTSGSYYVIATNNSTSCTSRTAGATVTINPLPTVYTLSGGSACAGSGGVDVATNASDAGNSYQLYLTGTGTVGSAISGGSGTSPYPIDFGNQSTSGSYYVVATNNTTSCTSTTADATVTINALPSPTFASYPSANICTGASVTYTTQSSESDYSWTVPGVAGIDYNIISGGISSTDYTVTIQWITIGSQTVSVNYLDGNSCSGASSASNTTNVHALPAAYTLSTDGGDPATLSLVNSDLNVSYTVFGYSLSSFSGSTAGEIESGTGSGFSFTNTVIDGMYFVQVDNTVTGCTSITDTVKVGDGGRNGGGSPAVTPNPSTGTIVISGPFGSSRNEDVDIEITDMVGQKVATVHATTMQGFINTQITLDNSLANGMYLLTMHSPVQSALFHIMLLR